MMAYVARKLGCELWRYRVNLYLALTLLTLLSCCLSCDAGFKIPFGRYNASWSSDHREGYDYYFEGWHIASRQGKVVVLQWKGKGQLGAEATTIILCLQRVGQEPDVAFRLTRGLVVSTSLGKIWRIQTLAAESFSCELLRNARLRVSYDGPVGSGPVPVHLHEPRYLRLSVVSREDGERTVTILEQLYPQLKEQGGEETLDVVTCIESLLDARDRP